MAWDLWSSSCDQVACGGNYSQHPQWQCDFYFGCGHDVIEEDALNEKSCARVLRILITKADSEIEELEKDLLSLQNELAWAEHEKWPDICCNALTERINRLDDVVSTLRNDCASDTELQLLLGSEPAETLNEIVKALQRDLCQDTLSQHLDVNVTEHALDKVSSTIDSNIILVEEGEDLYETSENSCSSELPSQLHEKRSDNPGKIEELPEESPTKKPELEAIICAPDHSDGMKLSEASDITVAGNEDVRRNQLVTTDSGQILKLFSSKGNGYIPSEAKKENEFVEDKDVSDDFTTSVKGRKMYASLGTSQQQKSGNSDLEEKLCDFAPKTAQRACKNDSKVAQDEALNSVNLPLQVVYPQRLCIADTEFHSFKASNGTNSGQVINAENATLIHAENSALISMQGMQTKNALCTGLHLTDVEKSQAHDYESEIAAVSSKSNMSFPSKVKSHGKQRPELEAIAVRKPHDSCTEIIPSTSIVVSTKRQRKSKPCNDGAVSNESMNRKITKRAVQPGKQETEGRAIVLYDSKFCELQKKRKVSKLPIPVEIQNSTVNEDNPNSDRVSMDNGSQIDLHIGKSYSLSDSNNETSSLSLLPWLKRLKLSNLRAMAKEHKVEKYYKLGKAALVEQLVERLSSC